MTFEIKTFAKCEGKDGKITFANVHELEQQPRRQLELRQDNLEVKQNGQPVSCIDFNRLKSAPKAYAVVPPGSAIVEIRAYKKAGDKDQDRTYYLCPAGTRQDEAELIRDLINWYVLRNVPSDLLNRKP